MVFCSLKSPYRGCCTSALAWIFCILTPLNYSAAAVATSDGRNGRYSIVLFCLSVALLKPKNPYKRTRKQKTRLRRTGRPPPMSTLPPLAACQLYAVRARDDRNEMCMVMYEHTRIRMHARVRRLWVLFISLRFFGPRL